MDQVLQSPIDAPLKKNRMVIVISSIIGIIVVMLYGVFLLSTNNKLPEEFFSTFDHQNKIAKEIISETTFDYNSLAKVLKDNNYKAAVEQMTVSFESTQKAEKESQSLSSASIKLKTLLPKLKDSASGQKILSLFGIIDDRNNKLTALISTEQPFYVMMHDTYAMVVSQGRAQIPPDAEKKAQQILSMMTEIQALQTQIDGIYSDIRRDSGFDDQSQSVKASDMENALHATPIPTTILPTVADTPLPAAENLVPLGPNAPEGGIEATASAEASRSAR